MPDSAWSGLTFRPTRTSNIKLPLRGVCCLPLASNVRLHGTDRTDSTLITEAYLIPAYMIGITVHSLMQSPHPQREREEMSKILTFPMVNLRQEIQEGRVSTATKDLIRSVLLELNEFHPNSWDKKFCEDMLVNTGPISDKQANQLGRILWDILAKTEHPSFTPKFDL